ncbi:hypothetical protein GTO89_00510 [Heliobacterium gestii]|uniref:Fibronectin type-III domain-containing protein n=1 Tax=Heliomicrobium gestii TaxID=2699 RepID=A0A845L8H2_HELGE|nr:hypothetical protein [Heliomicrobium gestii]MBM7865249.1 hypothetical protein [Heliomicrobium gestii]MZP41514.1 hypothetical protein [Heliomicrobium gestii]
MALRSSAFSRMLSPVSILLLISLLFQVTTASAGPVSPPTLTYSPGIQAYLATYKGEYTVNNTVYQLVYGAYYAPDGTSAVNDFVISDHGAGADASASYGRYGQFEKMLTLWTDPFQAVPDQVYGRVIGCDTHYTQTPAPINQGYPISAGPGYLPRSAYCSEPGKERFLAVWQQGGNDSKILGRFVGLSGEPFGNVITIGDGLNPAITYNPLLKKFVVFRDGGYGWLLSPNGAVELAFETTASHVYSSSTPVTAWDADDKACLIATRFRDNANNNYTILGQVVDVSSGTPSRQGEAFTITTGYPSLPSLAYDGLNKRFLVSWRENSSLYVRFVHADGTTEGGPIVLALDLNPLMEPALASDESLSTFLFAYVNTSGELSRKRFSATPYGDGWTPDSRIHVSNVTDNGINFTWDGMINTDDQQFRFYLDNVYQGTVVNDVYYSYPGSISGLSPEQEYLLRVESIDENGVESANGPAIRFMSKSLGPSYRHPYLVASPTAGLNGTKTSLEFAVHVTENAGSGSSTAIFQLSKGNIPIQTQTYPLSQIANGQRISWSLPYPLDAGDYTVKVFLWDSLDGMSAKAKRAERTWDWTNIATSPPKVD